MIIGYDLLFLIRINDFQDTLSQQWMTEKSGVFNAFFTLVFTNKIWSVVAMMGQEIGEKQAIFGDIFYWNKLYHWKKYETSFWTQSEGQNRYHQKTLVFHE